MKSTKFEELVEFRCDYCNKLVAKEEVNEDIVIEIKCPRCGKVSKYIIYKIG